MQVLTEYGIEIPPEIISGELAGQDSVLLENGDVYGSRSLMTYVGRVDETARAFIAQQGGPPELPGVWCERGWRVRLDRHFEELLFTGRVQGFSLDTSRDVWFVFPRS